MLARASILQRVQSQCTQRLISRSTFPHFTSIASEAQRGRPLTQGHTGTGLYPGRGAASSTAPGGGGGGGCFATHRPPSGRSRPEPLLLPAPEGRPGGRAEEVSAAGRNASGRGAAAGSGGDCPAGSRGGGAERARCLTSPWCRWTGRGAATMTTSRVSVGWTTGSARSGRTRTVRARGVGALAGAGERATRGPRSHIHPNRESTRRCGPNFC